MLNGVHIDIRQLHVDNMRAITLFRAIRETRESSDNYSYDLYMIRMNEHRVALIKFMPLNSVIARSDFMI